MTTDTAAINGSNSFPTQFAASSIPKITYTDEELKLIRENIFKGVPEFQFLQGMRLVETYGIDLFIPGQFYVTRRFDKQNGGYTYQFTVGHPVMLGLAHALGMKKLWHELKFEESDALQQHPISDTVHIVRFDGAEFSKPTYFSDYYELDRDGKPKGTWATRPHVMLEKCAEAATIRIAFKLRGLYTREEVGDVAAEEKETGSETVYEDTPRETFRPLSERWKNPAETCGLEKAQEILDELALSSLNPHGLSDDDLQKVYMDARIDKDLFNLDKLNAKLREVQGRR